MEVITALSSSVLVGYWRYCVVWVLAVLCCLATGGVHGGDHCPLKLCIGWVLALLCCLGTGGVRHLFILQ